MEDPRHGIPGVGEFRPPTKRAGRRPRAVGDRWQRECVKVLREAGYYALNIGTKGAAGPFDVMAWRYRRDGLHPQLQSRVLLVQVKYAGSWRQRVDSISRVRRDLAAIPIPDANIELWIRYADEWEIIPQHLVATGGH